MGYQWARRPLVNLWLPFLFEKVFILYVVWILIFKLNIMGFSVDTFRKYVYEGIYRLHLNWKDGLSGWNDGFKQIPSQSMNTHQRLSGETRMNPLLSLLGLFSMLFFLSCSYQQDYIRGEEIHAKARRVAVLPMVNLTTFPNAGRIVLDLLTTELYANTGFQIMEQTEVLKKMKGSEEDLDHVLDNAVALRVGESLGVDTVIFGSVTEYRYKRGLDESPVVGVNIRMLDIKTSRILWSGSKSGIGGCFWFCEDSLNRLAQKVCHDLVLAMSKKQS